MTIVNIPELTSKYVGESEHNVVTIFKQAREKAPCIIFIDEVDGLLQRRTSSEGSTGDVMRNLTNTLLTQMDGINKNNDGVFILASTNLPWQIDLAFRRSGRLEDLIYVAPPTLKERKELFQFYTKNIPNNGKLQLVKLALLSFSMSPADIASICNNAIKDKASNIAFENKKDTPLNTIDLIGQINSKGEPFLINWFASALQDLRNMKAEERDQYRDLKKDIIFFHENGKSYKRIYKLIGSLIWF